MTHAQITISVGSVSRIVTQAVGPLSVGEAADLAGQIAAKVAMALVELARRPGKVVVFPASTAEADHGQAEADHQQAG